AAYVARSLAEAPRTGNIGPTVSRYDIGEWQQKHCGADQVDDRFPPQAPGPIEDINPNVALFQQHITRDAGEHDTIHPDIQVLHPDEAYRENIAQGYDGEADQHNSQREPGEYLPKKGVDAADRFDDQGDGAHRIDPLFGIGGEDPTLRGV